MTFGVKVILFLASQLSEQERIIKVSAASLFDEMEVVAAHSTQCPLYYTVAVVNILPTRLRSSRARDAFVGMICIVLHIQT